METKIKTIVIATINGIDILASVEDEELVPIKPICDLFGIDAKNQRDKLNSNPLYSSVGVLSTSTGADGKQYEMYCLPYEYCLAWMLGINSANVKSEVREKLLDYQKECVLILKEHFYGKYCQLDLNLKKAAKRKARIKVLKEDIQNNPPADERIKELMLLEDEDKKESRKPFADMGKKMKVMVSFFTEKEMLGKKIC